jgi:hypothetical protein
MPSLFLDKKDLIFLQYLLKKETNLPLFAQNLLIYITSIIDAPDKPAWINNPDSASISALLTDDSNL